MTYQEMIANADANGKAMANAREGKDWRSFNNYLIGALLNYVAPEDFKKALETAAKLADPLCKHGKRWADCEPCRGWTERARLLHIYGVENI